MWKLIKCIISFISIIGIFYTLWEIPEKFKFLLIILYPHIINPEDYRVLLYFFSLLTLLIINFNKIKLYCIRSKRKLEDDNNLGKQEFILALRSALENPKDFPKEIISVADKTYIVFDADRFDFLESRNITSITDNGINDVIFSFSKDLPKNYTINISGNKGNINFRSISLKPSSAHIIFLNSLEGIVRINFEV